MPTPLIACPRCACHHRATDHRCPHCGASRRRPMSAATAALLGALVTPACVSMYGIVKPDYGIAPDDSAIYDADGDGYALEDGDCDDADATIHPGAEETPGDEVDSNCDGEDDT